MTGSPAASAMTGRGSPVQRVRVALLRGLSWIACRLPEGVAIGLAEVVGWLWSKVAPARAAQARRNFRRVAAALDAEGRGPARVRAAAHDERALDRLVTASFQHDARYYLEVLRVPSLTADIFDRRVVIETSPDNIASRKGIEAAGFRLCREISAWIVLNSFVYQKRTDLTGCTRQMFLV